jgi:signal transduction histidine kinase
LVTTGTVALILNYVGYFSDNLIGSILILFAQLLLSTVASIVIYKFIARPLKDLMAVIMHISGEPTDSAFPNPNNGLYADTGFRSILQTLYSLAGTEPGQSIQKIEHPSASVEVLSSALDGTHCGIIIMNHDREITYANRTAPVNISPEGKSVLHLFFGGNNTLDEWLTECDQNAVHAERTWSRVADRLPEEDGRRFFDVIASYNKDSSNETILTLVDRTSIYEVGEEELDFIAFAAHELRGPITVIRGYLDVLQDELKPVLAEDQKELFHRLTVSANRLTGYVNNILNTSRYDRRHLRVRLHEVSLSSIYESIRDDMNMRAAAQGRLLSVAIASDLPKIAGDAASLSEVFSNLIDNAIKYSNEGGAIKVSAAVKGDFVEVAIEDHGIGMPATVIGNLFNKFYRSHRSRETVAGTGIGLYISKALVESHGGTIRVQSEEGVGSVFTVAIPTYASVADTLKAGHNSNEGLIEQGSGWISNHSMYRG